MTAYELADYLDNNVEAMLFTEQKHLDDAATMLRKQAGRIAELKKTSTPAKTEEYIESLKKRLAVYATTLYETKMAAQEVNTRKNKRIAELEAKLDEMAGEVMSLENQIGMMTGYGHN